MFRSLLLCLLFIIAVLFTSVTNCHAQDLNGKLDIVFINPGNFDPEEATGSFWREVSTFMEAVANDLDMNLEILYAERNHIQMVQLAEKVLKREKLPDYLMVVNEKLAAGRIVAQADAKGVKVFSLLTGFYGKQAKEMGPPRTKFKNWIGELVPDNKWAGYQLAKSLILQAMAKGYYDKNITFLPITGDYATHTTLERGLGLDEARREFSELVMLPETHCLWREDKAFEITSKFIKRDPSINIVWAANDPMALGAVKAAKLMGAIPGENFFVGGINWDKSALMAINDGALSVSVGGHFMTGGWGLVMLYDYHRGIDFSGPDGAIIKERIFDIITKDNVERFIKKFGTRDWNKVDFKKFTKIHNQSLKKYDFSIKALISN